MGIDTVKVVYTYTIATLVIAGGFAILYLSRLDPPTPNSLGLVMAGFVGAAIQFVFNRETQTSTARQVERGVAQGAASQPTTTVSGDPPTTTVTPAPPPAADLPPVKVPG